MVRRTLRYLTGLPQRPLPAPPTALRRGPWRPGAFTSRLRSPRLTAQVGLWLGISFGVCFVTGLLSHAIQHPPAWFWWPSRPVALYRTTQGLHVATGLAGIPLLGVKLWSVYPKLFTWPPARSVAHALERVSLAVLISAALFQLATGLLNVAHWYSAMPFGFNPAHYWTAWLVAGSVVLHVAVQLPIIRDGLARPTLPAPPDGGGLTRRGLLVATAAAVTAVTAATVGQTMPAARRLSALAPRRPDLGPQRLPVNTPAADAGVSAAAVDAGYRLVLTGPAGRQTFTLAELERMPQHTVNLPITCVEGWSADAQWTGVRLRDLAALVGASAPTTAVVVESLQRGGPYRSSIVDPAHAADPLTLLALRLHGEPLHLDHGYPCRLIAPNRPGVLQTKWVAAITVMPP
jgi:DMSO/TMAO reductase YedYZ molybdopterin-dependent catalytic subunit